MTAQIETHDTKESIYRYNAGCDNCGTVVSENDLIPCYDDDGLKDFACPNCFTAHKIVEGQ